MFLFFMPGYSPTNIFVKAQSQIDDLYLIIHWVNATFHGIARAAEVGKLGDKSWDALFEKFIYAFLMNK